MDIKREKVIIRCVAAVMAVGFLFFLFEPKFVGFLGKEALLVEIYNQCINLGFSYCISNFIFYKLPKVGNVVTVALFFVLNCFVEVETDFPEFGIFYVLLVAAALLFVALISLLYKILNESGSNDITRKRRIVTFSVLATIAISVFVLCLCLWHIKYNL